ncbi:MAG: hypothetical protein KF906_10075 [Actinobacteria bacterium]|nr:hypothetical protein [Actinomycetota bacterium]
MARGTRIVLWIVVLAVAMTACSADGDGDTTDASSTTRTPTNDTSLEFRPVLSIVPGSGTCPDVTPDGDLVLPSTDGTTCYGLGDVVADESAVASASAALANDAWVVILTFDGPGRDELNDALNDCFAGAASCPATAGTAGTIAIVLDEEVVSAPAVVGSDLGLGEINITGNFDQTEAEQLAAALAP